MHWCRANYNLIKTRFSGVYGLCNTLYYIGWVMVQFILLNLVFKIDDIFGINFEIIG